MQNQSPLASTSITRVVRRQFVVCAAVAVAISLVSPTAWAETYPERPVRIIVPFGAGGPSDLIARVIAQKLSERWTQKPYVENIAGAGGNIGMATAAKAAPDGHTILVVTSSFVANPSLYARIPYDPIKDFTPVTLVAASSNVLVCHPSVPANNLKELVALIKANPGKYSYASPGWGTTGQLAGELFKLSQGLDLAHVPFGGAGPAIISTIGGHTPIAAVALPGPAAENIRDGRLRALAVTSSKRFPAFPDVPTMAEAGFPGQESVYSQGIVTPAGTPKEIVDLWYREVARIVALPDVKERLTAVGFDPVANTPEEFGSWIKGEVPRWAKVIRDANIKRAE